MKRYYFDLVSGNNASVDEEGLDLPSLQVVQEEAALALAALAREVAEPGAEDKELDLAIDVRDEAGPVLKVLFVFQRGNVQ